MTISGTKEWAEHSLNIARGCSHDCRYCYARAMAVRYGLVKDADWKNERINSRQPSIGKKPGRIMFPTTHDITPGLLAPALAVIRKVLDKGNSLLIVSKPHLQSISAICQEAWADKNLVIFRFTIGSINSDILKYWEPGAPSFEERLECLKLAHREGFETSVSAEPLLDATHALDLVDTLAPYITDSIWIGKLNQIRSRVKVMDKRDRREVERIKAGQTDAEIKELYASLKDHPKIKWKESIKAVVGLALASRPGQDI